MTTMRRAESLPLRTPDRRGARRLTLVVGAAAGLVLSVHLTLTVFRTDRARVTFDSAQYAVAGREWARSGRLATTFVLPREPRHPTRPPFPLLLGHPLVPALNALALRIAGPSGDATLAPPALAFVALVVLALALAFALGASPGGAAASAAAVALAPGVLRYASEGLTEVPFAALLAALTLMLARERPPHALLFGALLGLAHLTRPIMVPLLPVALAGLAVRSPRGERIRTLAFALASFLPFAVALAAYKVISTGDPLAEVARYNLLIGLTPALTAFRIQCMVEPPAPLPMMLAHLDAVALKLGAALPDLALGLFAQAGLLGPIAAAALVAGLAGRRERVPAAVVLGFAAAIILTAALTLPSRRYLAPLLPLLLVAAIVAVDRAARAARFPSTAVAAITALMVLLTSGRETARDWRRALEGGARDRGVFTETEWRSAGERLASLLPPRTLVASDAGAFIAWYADRPTVLIPERPSDLGALGRRLDIGALALTNEWLLDQPGFESWRTLADRPGSLAGWRHAATVRSGRMRVVILTRERPDAGSR